MPSSWRFRWRTSGRSNESAKRNPQRQILRAVYQRCVRRCRVNRSSCQNEPISHRRCGQVTPAEKRLSPDADSVQYSFRQNESKFHNPSTTCDFARAGLCIQLNRHCGLERYRPLSARLRVPRVDRGAVFCGSRAQASGDLGRVRLHTWVRHTVPSATENMSPLVFGVPTTLRLAVSLST